MSRIEIEGMHLVRDGKPFFWLADTIWTAFTSPTDDEWIEYLDQRAAEGFNVLQINALPQWDRSSVANPRYPYATADGGVTFDFAQEVPEYWEHARWQLREAVKRGFTPALVVQWCNYVPNTWASNMAPQNIIPEELVEPVVSKICSSFNEFDPIYIISGDTDFDHKETIERYMRVTNLVERYAPYAHRCYHIKGRYDGLPECLAERADIYLYQSGHNISAQAGAYTLARSFAARPNKRPIINSEPCYEQMGYSHMLYGRFRQEDCRRALWLSLLGGASAGVTYGAHGVWNWQGKKGGTGLFEGEGFLKALPHEAGLQFPGARDFGFVRTLVERMGLFELVPAQEVLATHADDVFASKTSDGSKLLVYVPYNADIRLAGDFSSSHARAIDLAARSVVPLEMRFDAEKGTTLLSQGTWLEDAALVLDLA
ncbi:MAG: DUF4038 domain-containing protein [Atopobiaceae bacterium]|nr:DUF4038 domain-containing protein [Atopobiaceae bacterium]MDY4652420.1 DUF4038 domain-containing protein [Atopobiaceae bacterium]MDY5002872.1 DUF4038 domain-containing protein [Atopobiaceae bacterium]